MRGLLCLVGALAFFALGAGAVWGGYELPTSVPIELKASAIVGGVTSLAIGVWLWAKTEK